MNGGEQPIFGSHAGQREVRLTTRGRKSGETRTVTIWFVPSSKSSIYVQHVSRRPAHWYRNLLAEQRVEVDFGDGPIAATAIPITDPAGVREVRRLIRRKYLLAWVFQMLGWGAPSVAAEIRTEKG